MTDPTTKPLPPGSRGFPLIGETLAFLKDGYAFVEARVAEHGPVFRTNVLGRDAAVLVGPEGDDVLQRRVPRDARGRDAQAHRGVLRRPEPAAPRRRRAPRAQAAGARDRPMAIHVEAREEKDGSEVTVSFRDEGCGIRKEDLAHVFAPFATTKPGVRGLGLGNVKKMIESAHGGRVRIESERGKGTTVYLTLPKEQGA